MRSDNPIRSKCTTYTPIVFVSAASSSRFSLLKGGLRARLFALFEFDGNISAPELRRLSKAELIGQVFARNALLEIGL